MPGSQAHKGDYHQVRTVKGINPELWKWMRARATLENESMGELLNELIDGYRLAVEEDGPRLEFGSPYEADLDGQHSVRGIDPGLWRWLRARSILDQQLLSEVLNELAYRYMIAAEDVAPVTRTIYRKCVVCGRLFETESKDALTCSGRCRVALYRRRRSGRAHPER